MGKPYFLSAIGTLLNLQPVKLDLVKYQRSIPTSLSKKKKCLETRSTEVQHIPEYPVDTAISEGHHEKYDQINTNAKETVISRTGWSYGFMHLYNHEG